MCAREAPAVSAENLWKTYGRERVLRGVSLAVPAHASVAILGPNGSGKTTLLRVLAGASRPSRGRVRVHGEDPSATPGARRRIGFVTHEPMLYGGLSVLENLGLLATLYDLPDGRARAEAVCDLVGIQRRSDPVRALSRGVQQRAALARALLHAPAVLLLDEPFTGLDPEGAEGVLRILQRFCREGGTIVLTTHSASEALGVAETGTVLAGGAMSPPRPLAGMHAEDVRTWYRECVGADR